MSNSPLIQLDRHTLQHQGVAVLDNISLKIYDGEKVALLGASGAGKSTLLNALRQQLAEKSAWCPQEGNLVPVLSVFHNIYMGALPRHSTFYNMRNLIFPSAKQKIAVTEITDALGLTEKLFTSIDRLSGGQAQRTALGRALFSHKTTLLADEPVSSIDEHQGKSLLQYSLSRHQSAVVALHDQQLALDCFDRIIGLKSGKILIDAPANELTLTTLQSLYQ